MTDRRKKPANRWGCKPEEDVCLEHDLPLECRHGCDNAKLHQCRDKARRLLETRCVESYAHPAVPLADQLRSTEHLCEKD